METSAIEALVLATIRLANQSRPVDKRVEESRTAVIFGSGSALDSIGLVTLLIDIEDALRDRGVTTASSPSRNSNSNVKG